MKFQKRTTDENEKFKKLTVKNKQKKFRINLIDDDCTQKKFLEKCRKQILSRTILELLKNLRNDFTKREQNKITKNVKRRQPKQRFWKNKESFREYKKLWLVKKEEQAILKQVKRMKIVSRGIWKMTNSRVKNYLKMIV